MRNLGTKRSFVKYSGWLIFKKWYKYVVLNKFVGYFLGPTKCFIKIINWKNFGVWNFSFYETNFWMKHDFGMYIIIFCVQKFLVYKNFLIPYFLSIGEFLTFFISALSLSGTKIEHQHLFWPCLMKYNCWNQCKILLYATLLWFSSTAINCFVHNK